MTTVQLTPCPNALMKLTVECAVKLSSHKQRKQERTEVIGFGNKDEVQCEHIP